MSEGTVEQVLAGDASWCVLHGDVTAVDLPPDVFDFLGCDPPYHLTTASRGGSPRQLDPTKPFGRHGIGARGFMGKTWDGGDVALRPETWARFLAACKPGAHLFAFGGTRTAHRIACAIEDGGWEIRDSLISLGLAWMYGCLSDDTEVLTESGWKLGVDVGEHERVAAWDSASGEIRLAEIEQKTVAPWDGELVRFASSDTDQLVTPNHRVYCRRKKRRMSSGVRRDWYEPTWEVAEAGSINRWNALRLPVSGEHDGNGIGGDDYAELLGWVWTEGGFDRSGTGVRIYQSPSANPDKCLRIQQLVERLAPGYKRYDRTRKYKGRDSRESCWFFSGEMATRVREDLPGKHPSWPLLWHMRQSEKRAFWEAACLGDGHGRQFFQKSRADLEWAQALVTLCGMRGVVGMRNNRDGGALYWAPQLDTELQRRHLAQSTQKYSGRVWCLKVATGAFVARRNGKVFITGNSGFPKSKNLGYGIGTALKPSWEPIVMARKPFRGTTEACFAEYGTGGLQIDACRVAHAGAADLAAHQAQVEAIKARGGSMANSWKNSSDLSGASDVNSAGRWPPNAVFTHHPLCRFTGTVDVAANPTWDTPNRETEPSAFTGEKVSKVRHANGREGESSADRRYTERGSSNFSPLPGARRDTETVEQWECVEGCPVRELSLQSGELSSGYLAPGTPRANRDGFNGPMPASTNGHAASTGTAARYFPQFQHDPEIDDVAPFLYLAKAARSERDAGLEHFRARSAAEATDSEDGQARLNSPRTGAGRTGGARNCHPTIKPIDLIRWIARLGKPRRPDGMKPIALVPFSGAGSEMIALVLEGYRVVGIELNNSDAEPYVEIARARLNHFEGRTFVPRETLRASEPPPQRGLFETKESA